MLRICPSHTECEKDPLEHEDDEATEESRECHCEADRLLYHLLDSATRITSATAIAANPPVIRPPKPLRAKQTAMPPSITGTYTFLVCIRRVESSAVSSTRPAASTRAFYGSARPKWYAMLSASAMNKIATVLKQMFKLSLPRMATSGALHNPQWAMFSTWPYWRASTLCKPLRVQTSRYWRSPNA